MCESQVWVPWAQESSWARGGDGQEGCREPQTGAESKLRTSFLSAPPAPGLPGGEKAEEGRKEGMNEAGAEGAGACWAASSAIPAQAVALRARPSAGAPR